MQFFRSLISLLLVFAISTMPIQGCVDFSKCSRGWIAQDEWLANLHLLTYDEILYLLDEIESGELEKRCSFAAWQKINQFLFTLANKGFLAQGIEIDTAEYNQIHALANDQSYIISNAVYYGDGEIFYSEVSWASAWQNTKDFYKKHKQAIIIGVVVVVAVVAIAVVASSATAGAMATAVAAGAAHTNDHAIPNSPTLEKEQEIASFEPIESNQPSALKEIICEHLEPIKELSKEREDATFREKAREFGSYLTHEALYGISELTSVLPELQKELIDLSEKLLPQEVIPEESRHAKDNFDTWIAQGHKKIDQAFSTDHADYYAIGARSEQNSQYTIGMIPPPGKALEFGSKELKRLAASGKAIDRAGFTKAGRSLMKHGYREDSVFPKPTGNAKQINEHGQKMLESILYHPEKLCFESPHKHFGTVIEVHVHEIGGARFKVSGEFIGFLEP